MPVHPFRIDTPQPILDDLRDRLAHIRFPDEVEGTNLSYMKELADYWLHTYDWRAREAESNRFAHYTADIDGTELRFIHESGKGPDPLPIILTHGWPDSFYRYHKIIPMLTDRAAYSGEAAAFQAVREYWHCIAFPSITAHRGASSPVPRPQPLSASAGRDPPHPHDMSRRAGRGSPPSSPSPLF